MRQQITEALKQLHPLMKDYVVERCVSKYIEAVMHEIATQFMYITSEDIEAGEMDFAYEDAKRDAGRIKVDDKDVYILQVMHEHASTSLVIRTYKGNSITHRVSRVTLNPIYKKNIMEELANLTIELNPARLKELDEKANVSIDVDVAALESFRTATREALKHQSPNEQYEAKLLRNLQVTNQLLSQVKTADDGSNYLDEYWEEIDSGRVHGHGVSLQRVSKEVRHAALGNCHRYDFKASSFALMTTLALQIDPTLRVAALKDYIKYRAAIRTRIAADIGVSEKQIKAVFTSLGFGATLRDTPFHSIRGALGKEKFNRLLENTEFVMIKTQLEQVSNTIDAAFPDEFELLGRTYTRLNPKDKTKRTKAQKLAWIYQCLESDALAKFISYVPTDYPIQLQVHDCLYLKSKLPSHHIADIKWKLQKDYALLNFEHEEIFPIHAAQDHGKEQREILAKEYAHKQFIAQQEEVAADYVSASMSNDTSSKKKQVQTPWGMVDADMYEPHQQGNEHFKGGYFGDSYTRQ